MHMTAACTAMYANKRLWHSAVQVHYGSKLKHHLLRAYRRALVSVLLVRLAVSHLFTQYTATSLVLALHHLRAAVYSLELHCTIASPPSCSTPPASHRLHGQRGGSHAQQMTAASAAHCGVCLKSSILEAEHWGNACRRSSATEAAPAA